MAVQRKQFPFSEFESQWQKRWLEDGSFRAAEPGDENFDPARPKTYILDMFPYPSGDGLHIGHPLQKTACDIVARQLRMRGHNVLFPAGWDSFGLPAEQYAIKTGQHPRVTTEANIANFTRQLKQLGFSYDWSREVATSEPDYYKWTQWIFLKIYGSYYDEAQQKARPIGELAIPADIEAGGPDAVRDYQDSRRLAYVSEQPVNWSPDLGTVLANEEVEEWTGKGFRVERRPLRQWMLRITAYAQRLIDELTPLDWPESLKAMQRNWIGRSEGALVEFRLADHAARIEVFTTRPDTLFGATYMVLAPEHPLVAQITTEGQRTAVENYQKEIATKSDLERTELTKEKSGVATGAFAINPVNNERIPVWVADYVLMGYGTGAIMAVPAHDERDFEFATKFGLAIREVVQPAGKPQGSQGGTDVPSVTIKQDTDETSVPLSGNVAPSVSSPFFEPRQEIDIHERGLPHWQQAGKLYFLTWRLADSLPAEKLAAWNTEIDAWKKANPAPWTSVQEAEYHQLGGERVEQWLDAGHGSCLLKRDELADVVVSALRHFDAQKYELHTFVVMPNHVHVLIRLFPNEELPSILHGWKGWSATEINKRLGKQGTIWQSEYFDRMVRSPLHAERIVAYIGENARKAGISGTEKFYVKAEDTDETSVPPFQNAAAFKSQRPQGGTDVPSVTKSPGSTDVPSVTLKKDTDETSVPLSRNVAPSVFSGEGVAINSDFLDGLPTREATGKMISWLEEKKLGRGTINFKMRDWLFSRQRYWGEPFPIVWKDGRHYAIPESELPLLPPEMEDFQPAGDGRSPLAKAADWVLQPDGFERETNTMPQWAGSCWYHLRYLDPKNAAAPVDAAKEKYWMQPHGVDLYVGGVEHAVLHLLYARFWHKVLFDLGHVSTREPYFKLLNQGLILGEDGQKMSKSRGNVINPDHVVEEFGADSLRLFEMFMGPFDQVKPWSKKGVEGLYRFLARVWRLAMEENQEGTWVVSPTLAEIDLTPKQLRVAHATIKKVTEDIASFAFNTAISQMMILTNEFVNTSPRPVAALRILLPLLSPFAPHMAEEIWERLSARFAGFEGRASTQSWPVHEEKFLVVDEVEYGVQINGKLRDRLTGKQDAANAELEQTALALPKVQEAMAGRTVVKVIVVRGKLINIVAK